MSSSAENCISFVARVQVSTVSQLGARQRAPEGRACVSSIRLGTVTSEEGPRMEHLGERAEGTASSQDRLLPQPKGSPAAPHALTTIPTTAITTSLNQQLLLVSGGIKRVGTPNLEPRPWRRSPTTASCWRRQ
ncbi:E3 Ubiquitin-Protein Ligase Chfr [Manis pentadactyla]|nr:E3 Ubiquitin-Protein Ligase Chfr [Manis pentadactyla]